MILIYTTAETDAERYDIDDLTAVESEAVERVTGLDWDEVEVEIKAQKPGTLRALLWVFRKRGEPTLRYSDFDVPGWRKSLRARLTAEETAEHVTEIVRQVPEDKAEDRDRLLYLLRRIAIDPADVDAALTSPAPKGKAPAASAPSGAATGGTSPTT